jgi:hypothetical protein
MRHLEDILRGEWLPRDWRIAFLVFVSSVGLLVLAVFFVFLWAAYHGI